MKQHRIVLDMDAINAECEDKLRNMYIWQRQVWLRGKFPYLFSIVTNYQNMMEDE